MNRRRVTTWMIVLAGLVLLALGAGKLLEMQELPTASLWTAVGISALAYIWMMWGLWRTREFSISKRTLAIVISGTVAFAIAWALHATRNTGWAIAVIGMWSMVSLFIVGLALVRLVLSFGSPIAGVARTLVDEAIRMKVAIIFIVGLVLLVPILPFALDPEEQLRYRLQFFLTWSLGGMSVLLSLLTIFLACSSICNEIEQKQIFMTMAKPISRGQYLLGKWLGICMLNLVLVAIAGGTVYVLAVMLQRQPAQSISDRLAVDEQLMVARQSILPQPPETMDISEIFAQRVKDYYDNNPEMAGKELTSKQQQQILTQIFADWHSIGPRERKTYVFKGVDKARRFSHNRTAQLRWKPNVVTRPKDDIAYMMLWINDIPLPMDEQGRQRPVQAVVRNFSVLNLPLDWVSDDGEMRVTIGNPGIVSNPSDEPTTISFAPQSDLELLYKVDRFEPNLVRGLIVIWVRLAFLAMLGLAAGTFLGFPVATLVAGSIYVVALSSGFLTESLGYFAGLPEKDLPFLQRIGALIREIGSDVDKGKYEDVAKTVIRLVAEGFVAMVPSFGEYNPVPLVSDGRLVSWQMLGRAVGFIGVLWGGGCAVVGWLIFRRRELARVTV